MATKTDKKATPRTKLKLKFPISVVPDANGEYDPALAARLIRAGIAEPIKKNILDGLI